MNTFYTDPTSAVDTTAVASSQLDVGGGLWDSVSGSLGKLLDVYTTIEVAKAQSHLPAAGVPVGYMRVPGTNNIVPAGTTPGAVGGISTTMLLMIGGGLLVLVLLLKKG